MEDVFDFVVTLSHAYNLVALHQFVGAGIAGGRPAGNNLHDFGGSVFGTELRPDSAQGKVHIDVEIFLADGRHIIGVGVVGGGNSA